MLRCAAFDIGTNSTRMLIADAQAGTVKPLLTNLKMTRIGQGLGQGRLLCPAAIQRTVDVIEQYAGIAREFRVCKTRIIATSAVRDAANAGEFVNLVKNRTGLIVEVISGEEEAFLSYKGARLGTSGEDPVVIDIGGGSTEIIWSGNGGLICRSLDLGAVRLTEQPVLVKEIKTNLEPVISEFPKVANRPLIGVGGTITSLAAIDQKLVVYDPGKTHGYVLPRKAVKEMLAYLSALTQAERSQVPGLQPERADIIVAGTAILLGVLELLPEASITVSETDILHGIILSLTEPSAI